MVYSDIDSNKKAFIFELDNVLYPEKDYLLQVYYLFAGFLEYTELLDAKIVLKLMTDTYYANGPETVFDELKAKFKIDEKYRQNLWHLMLNAKLPLKLLLYKEMLALLQEMVVDRKQIFIITNGDPQLQLNKMRQTEWNGLGEYLTCYFATEFAPLPETNTIEMLLNKHQLKRRDIMMVGNTSVYGETAIATGIDYLRVESFLTHY